MLFDVSDEFVALFFRKMLASFKNVLRKAISNTILFLIRINLNILTSLFAAVDRLFLFCLLCMAELLATVASKMVSTSATAAASAASKTTVSAAPSTSAGVRAKRPDSKTRSETKLERLQREKDEVQAKLETVETRWKKTAVGFEAMAIVQKYSTEQALHNEEKLRKRNDELGSKIDVLTKERDEAAAERQSLCDRHAEALDRVSAEKERQKHEAVERLTHEFSTERKQLKQKHNEEKDQLAAEADEKRANEVAQVKHEIQVEIEELKVVHEAECSRLRSRISELEQGMESLKRQRDALEETLKKDASEKLQAITDELKSTREVMEMRMKEMRELRLRNQELEIENEQIPVKDGEIRKLMLRNADLTENIEKRKSVERSLLSKYEEAQQSARKMDQMSQSLYHEKEVLAYRLAEVTEAPPGSVTQNRSASASAAVRFRGRSSNSESANSNATDSRPVSAHNGHFATPTHSKNKPDDSLMTRSALSYYQEEGRKSLRQKNGSRSRRGISTTIYTANGAFSQTGSSDEDTTGSTLVDCGKPPERRRLTYDDDVAEGSACITAAHDGPAANGMASEAYGSGPSAAVTDSGIFSSLDEATASNDLIETQPKSKE